MGIVCFITTTNKKNYVLKVPVFKIVLPKYAWHFKIRPKRNLTPKIEVPTF